MLYLQQFNVLNGAGRFVAVFVDGPVFGLSVGKVPIGGAPRISGERAPRAAVAAPAVY